MYKIYVDSRLRKETAVILYLRKLGFWFKKARLVIENDPAVAVSEILDKNKLKVEDITVFEIYPGPGSFTGLKMGFSAINAFKWALQETKPSDLTLPQYGAEPYITPPKAKKVV